MSTPTSRSTRTARPERPEGEASSRARILGIDPGCVTTGWGLVTGGPAKPVLLEAGLISLGRGSLAGRLARLRSELDSLLERLSPTDAAVELPFHGVNARSALQLAHARGVILASLGTARVPLAEYTPATIKQSVTGNGRADKGQVRTMVSRLLATVLESPTPADLSDALAVAMCHAQCRGFARRVNDAERGGRRGRGAVPRA